MSRKLTPKQLRAARLMVYGESSRDISIMLKLNATTLSRWKQKPEFIMEYDRVLNEQQKEMRYRLANLAAASVDALWMELHQYGGENDRIKVALNLVKMFGTPPVTQEKQPEMRVTHASDAHMPAIRTF